MTDSYRPQAREPHDHEVAALNARIDTLERTTTAATAALLERQATAQKEIADDIEGLHTQVRLLTDRPDFDLRRSEAPINGLDITDAIEWSLKHKSRDHIIVVPPGTPSGARPRWQLSRTIKFPRQHGGCIEFIGHGSNRHATGLHCEIEWTGPAHDMAAYYEARKSNPDLLPGSMFLYSSTDWRFKGSPRFYGKSTLCPEGAAIGLLTTKTGAYNAGRMDWDGANWYDFADVGIQIGKSVLENSNECNHWGRQGFHGCKTGFRVVGHQALMQNFDSVFFNGHVGVGFQYYASGCLWVDECYYNCVLLELNSAGAWDAGTSGKSTGKNNGVFVIRNIKSDTQAPTQQLLQCHNSLRADVVYDTGVLSGADTRKGTIIHTSKGVAVTCRNMRMLGGGGTIEGEGTVIMDACRRVSNVGTFADDVRGNVTLRQPNCVNYDGEPFPEPTGLTLEDVRREIANSKVVPQ